MSDSYRIVGLAGRGAVTSASSNGEERFEPFLADLVLWPEGGAEPDLSQVAQAAAEALSWHHESLRDRADAVASAVLAAGDFSAVEVTVQRPELQLGVPVLGVEVTVRRPIKARTHQNAAESARESVAVAAEIGAIPTPGRSVAGAVRIPAAAPVAVVVPVPAPAAVPLVVPESVPVPVPVPVPSADAEWPPVASGAPVPVPIWPSVSGSAAAESGAVTEPDAAANAEPDADDDDAEFGAQPDLGAPAESETEFESSQSADIPSDPHEGDVPWDRTIPASQLAEAGHAMPSVSTLGAASSLGTVGSLGAAGVLGAAELSQGDHSGFAPPPALADPALAPALAEPGPDLTDAAAAAAAAAADDDADADEPALSPTFAVARRPSIDAPLPALLVLTGTGARAKEELAGAVGAIASAAGVDLEAVSPLARTTVVGGDTHTAVIRVRTTLEPAALALALRDAVERRDGVKAEMLSIEGMLGVFDGIELPLPGVSSRASVLVPWAQLEPSAVLPGLGGGPVVVLAETAPDREDVRWLALDWT